MFTAEEHVFSRGLGNVDEKVLPPGVVCDKCNRRRLSVIDQTLVDFPPIQQFRTVLNLRTRTGRVAPTEWVNATVSSPEFGAIVIEDHGHDAFTDHGDGRLTTHFTTTRISAAIYHRMMRAIYKIGLELIYLDRGPSVAFDPKFDELRSIVIGKLDDCPGWLILKRDAAPHAMVQAKYWYSQQLEDGTEILPLVVDIFGMEFWTELLARDPRHADDVPDAQWNKYVFEAGLCGQVHAG